MIVETSTWPEQSFCSFFWYTEDVKRGGDNFLAQAHMISDSQMQEFVNIQKIIHLKKCAKKNKPLLVKKTGCDTRGQIACLFYPSM